MSLMIPGCSPDAALFGSGGTRADLSPIETLPQRCWPTRRRERSVP